MEEDERPTKIRKLSPEESADHQAQDVAILEATVEAATSNGNQMQNVEGHSESMETPSDNGTKEEKNGHTLDKERKWVPPIDYSNPAYAGMSKNQVKKLIKKQEWESKRDERKVIRKEKIIAKRERRRVRRAAEDSAAAADPLSTNHPTSTVQKQKQSKGSVTLPITIVIDCNFDDLMRDNERLSLAAQITRCYSDTKSAPYRAHLAISSFSGKLRERFEGPLNSMYKSWRGVRFLEEDFVQTAEKAKEWMSTTNEKNINRFEGVFTPAPLGNNPVQVVAEDHKKVQLPEANARSQGEIVYLSSESDETLTELKPYSTYIIGGLVDKNREKGICYKRACEAGIKTARLPIGEFMEMQSRKVLATNHVNEILIKWLESGDWGDAFFKVIPKRKGGKLKASNTPKSGVAEEMKSQPEDEEVENDEDSDVGSNDE